MTELPEGDKEFEIRVTRLTMVPPLEPLFCELATDFELIDEAAGEFLLIRQKSDHKDIQPQEIRLTENEWPTFRKCVDYLLSNARKP